MADESQRAFTIEALSNLGLRHVRFAENWRRRGLAPGPADFAPLVDRVEALHGAGLSILLTVQADAPDAACLDRNRHSCLIAPDAPFERYLETLLARVGGQIDAIQFGNEWDSQFVGDAEDYLALHDRFARVVRRERPDLTIVLGGVTARGPYFRAVCQDGVPVRLPGTDLGPVLERGCGRDAARNRETLAALRRVMARADYDVADIHLYDLPDLWPAVVTSIAEISGGRPVWATEFGGPHPELEPRDPAYQAQRLPLYLETILALPLDRAYYFKLTDDPAAIHGTSGLYDRRGRPKPALQAFLEAIGR